MGNDIFRVRNGLIEVLTLMSFTGNNSIKEVNNKQMKFFIVTSILVFTVFFGSFKLGNKKNITHNQQFAKETFRCDLQFLRSKDSIIVLSNGDAQVVVSPKYQGKESPFARGNIFKKAIHYWNQG